GACRCAGSKQHPNPAASLGPPQPIRDERLEARRYAERVRAVLPSGSTGHGPTELDGIERVPTGDGMEPNERWPRELESESVAEQPVDAIDRQRADVDRGDAIRRRTGHDGIGRCVVDRPSAGDHTDGFVVETSKDVLE